MNCVAAPLSETCFVFIGNTQELVQHDLPYNLGEQTRYRGSSGIQPYVAYLLNCVLIPELRFADAGERWRVTARVLQVPEGGRGREFWKN